MEVTVSNEIVMCYYLDYIWTISRGFSRLLFDRRGARGS